MNHCLNYTRIRCHDWSFEEVRTAMVQALAEEIRTVVHDTTTDHGIKREREIVPGEIRFGIEGQQEGIPNYLDGETERMTWRAELLWSRHPPRLEEHGHVLVLTYEYWGE